MVESHYHPGQTFYTLCRSTASDLLRRHSHHHHHDNTSLDMASHYLISLLTLVLHSTSIYTVPTSYFCSHHLLPLLEALFTQKLSIHVSQNQHMLIWSDVDVLGVAKSKVPTTTTSTSSPVTTSTSATATATAIATSTSAIKSPSDTTDALDLLSSHDRHISMGPGFMSPSDDITTPGRSSITSPSDIMTPGRPLPSVTVASPATSLVPLPSTAVTNIATLPITAPASSTAKAATTTTTAPIPVTVTATATATTSVPSTSTTSSVSAIAVSTSIESPKPVAPLAISVSTSTQPTLPIPSLTPVSSISSSSSNIDISPQRLTVPITSPAVSLSTPSSSTTSPSSSPQYRTRIIHRRRASTPSPSSQAINTSPRNIPTLDISPRDVASTPSSTSLRSRRLSAAQQIRAKWQTELDTLDKEIADAWSIISQPIKMMKLPHHLLGSIHQTMVYIKKHEYDAGIHSVSHSPRTSVSTSTSPSKPATASIIEHAPLYYITWNSSKSPHHTLPSSSIPHTSYPNNVIPLTHDVVIEETILQKKLQQLYPIQFTIRDTKHHTYISLCSPPNGIWLSIVKTILQRARLLHVHGED